MFTFNGNKYRYGIMHKIFPLKNNDGTYNSAYLTINNPNVSYNCGLYQGNRYIVTLSLDPAGPQTQGRYASFFIILPLCMPYTYCTGNSYDTYLHRFFPLDKKTAPVAALAAFNLVNPQRNFTYNNNLKDNENAFGVNAPMATYYHRMGQSSQTGYYNKYLYSYAGGGTGNQLFTVGYPSNVSLNNVTKTFFDGSTSYISNVLIKNVESPTDFPHTYIEVHKRRGSDTLNLSIKVFATVNCYHNQNYTPTESDYTYLPQLQIYCTEATTSGIIDASSTTSTNTRTVQASRKKQELKKHIFTYDTDNETFLKNLWMATANKGTILPGFDTDHGPIEKFWDLYVIDSNYTLKEKIKSYNLNLKQLCANYYAEYEYTTTSQFNYISLVPAFLGNIQSNCDSDSKRAFSIENLIVAIDY